MHLLEINAEPLDGETNSREYDFSLATIDARWQAGYVVGAVSSRGGHGTIRLIQPSASRRTGRGVIRPCITRLSSNEANPLSRSRN